jgi:cell wall-associated NlpC family hydrolase
LVRCPTRNAQNLTGKTKSISVALAVSLLFMLAGGGPGRAAPAGVIENGTLSIPLRGYPEPPPPPKTPTPTTEGAKGGASLSTPNPANDAAVAAKLSQTVGRLGATIAPSSEIYRQRDPRSQLLARVPNTTYLAVKGQQDGYYAVLMVDGSIGWIPTTSVQILDYDVVADTRQPSPSRWGNTLTGVGAAVLREAYRYLGVRYSWGGNGFRGIDCSGLVCNCFAALGYRLPRTAHLQARVGTQVALSDLRAGDRLYFSVNRRSIDHTGIYIGGGHFIHAAMSRGQVGVDQLSKPLYSRSLVSAMRL